MDNDDVDAVNSKERLKQFIEQYESLPELWDSSNAAYMNKAKRRHALDKLLVTYKHIKRGATSDDVRKKINILRSNFWRKNKKVIASKRSGVEKDVYQSTSWTYYALQFLLKTDRSVANSEDSEEYSSRVDVKTEEEQEQYQISSTSHAPLSSSYVSDRPVSTLQNDVLRQQEQYQISSTSHATHSSSYVNDRPMATLQNDILRQQKQYQTPSTSHAVHSSSYVNGQPVSTPQNEILKQQSSYSELYATAQNNIPAIAMAWGEKLEMLDPHQRLFAEKAINDVLFEASLGTLDRFSVKINGVQ